MSFLRVRLARVAIHQLLMCSKLTLQGVPGVGGQIGLAVVPDEGANDGVVDPVRDDLHVDDEDSTYRAGHAFKMELKVVRKIRQTQTVFGFDFWKVG